MNIDHLFLNKAAPPWWLVFALIFLSPLPTYAAEPIFASGYPQIDANETKHSSLKLLVQTNENGKAYYVVLESGATAPSAAQVKAGQDDQGADVGADKKGVVTLTADTEADSYIIGLEESLPYDIYVVAEDSAEALNTPVLVAGHPMTTPAPADTTAPTFDDLGNPITLGETTIDFTVKTDEDGSAYYIVLDNDATVPADSQIKNGQESDNTDVDDTKKGELTLIANTGSVASVTGLIANTAYDIYVLAEDTEGNVTTGKIDVLLDSIAPEFADGYPKVENVTETTADLKIQTNEDGKAYYYIHLDPNAPLPTDKNDSNVVPVTLTANTEATENLTELEAETSYDVYIMVEDDAGNMTTTADSYPLTFTTSGGTGDITGDYDNTGNTITESDTITGTTTITGGTLDGSFDFTASGLDVTLNNVTLAASASINGGRLEGTITGDAGNPAILTNVTIGANAILINVIIGDGVIFEPGVTLIDVRFEGVNITVTDVTLKGTITVIETSITVFTNVLFGATFTELSGGTLSGEIESDSGLSGSPSLTGLTLLDVTSFNVVGISVTNVTFQGSFTTTSTTIVFTNVTFGVNFTSFSGGILSGTIATVAGFSGSASLTNLTLLDVASFNVTSVSVTNVILQGTFTTTSTITLTDVKLATGVVITGTGISLAGTIQPVVATASISLTNLNIAANSIVLKGIDLGSSVNQGTNVQVFTQTLQTVTGNVNFTGTTQTNINISAGATITGGTLAGAIIGDPVDPPTLNGVTISTGATLSNVILSSTVVLPSTINFGIGVRFTSLSILPFVGFNLTSILPVFTPPVIVGVTLPPILDLSGGLIAGGSSLFSAITPARTVNVFGSGSRISRRRGRLRVGLSNGGMCGFRPSRARSRGGRRRSTEDNSYGFGNALYITTPDDVEIVNQPSVQNLEALTAALTDKGFTGLEVLDNGNLQVTDPDGNTIIFRASITSYEVTKELGFEPNTANPFKDSNDGKVSFIFDDVDEEDGTTRREQVLYAAPAVLDDITDATLNTQNDQMGGSYPEDGEVDFTYNGQTYAGRLDWFVTTGAATRAAMAVAYIGDNNGDNNQDYQITYTDGTTQKLFTSTPITSGGVSTGGTSTGDDTTDDDTTGDDETDTTLSGIIDNTGKSLKDITFAANAEIKGGTLEGNITGAANGFAKLDNLTVAANSILNNVSLGKNVTFGAGVTLKDVLFMGASLSDIILEGTIRTASSATVITNPTLGDNAKIIGGKLAGIIKGNRAARALLQSLIIEENSQLTDILIGNGVDIPVTAFVGEGVQFTAVENIPFNVDLSGTLPGFAALVPEIQQPTALDLSGKLVEDGESLLVNINNIPFFAANGWKLDQSDKAGNLTLKIENFTFEIIPVKVTRVESNPLRAADESVRSGFGTSVYFTNEDGIEVEAHPAVQDIATLQALLAEIEIPKFNISKEGNIQIPVNNTTWISARAELASKLAEEDAEIGFKTKGDLAVLVFEKDGQKREQVLYPAPASNASIQLAEEASLTEQGILSFKFNETTYTGKLDYFVENGEATETYGITEIADSNGDGLPDFLMTYPLGYKQKLFALPPATE
jgi:acetyltransferase-like isoleucine patch superfamily enzyme